MASTSPPITTTTIAKLKQGSLLWCYGFKEACCLHRVVILCYRSRDLLIRTGQCSLFNGFIFLGSVSILKLFLFPMLQWLLPDQCPHIVYEEVCRYGVILSLYSSLRKLLIQLIYLLWFYPLYVFSVILSSIWYNDVAKHGFVAMGKDKPPAAVMTGEKEASITQTGSDKPAGLGGIMIGIGEQVYSALLLSFFFLEVIATGFIPYAGKALNFLLLSWMYAYYCFEYKWNLSGVTLDRRLDFFESNWAFFAGFGSPCVLAIFFFPPLESYAVMATLFPLFVLTATGSDADNLVTSPRKQWLGAGLGRVPIFCGADTVSMKVLSFLPLRQQLHNQGEKAL
ncbi:protein EI24 homolog isoform X1 [Beta vulgaris subsp. vulgaris]|uniref:protein EI24 homolog isoform X1 n=1 Tax=Beta vulgaris subsp. vulgaris TaxID=3555 RepID=UPI00203678ED|nr:protein EI24 homolog isoform X1 [Beta vulgaris subsp. vulgaris]